MRMISSQKYCLTPQPSVSGKKNWVVVQVKIISSLISGEILKNQLMTNLLLTPLPLEVNFVWVGQVKMGRGGAFYSCCFSSLVNIRLLIVKSASWVRWMVQPITLSLLARVEVELGSDNKSSEAYRSQCQHN